MPEMTFDFLGQAVTLPEPHERVISLNALAVSDVITPGREFVACVQRFGVITPIVVFDDGTHTHLRVADGRRRVAAARLAGLNSVPATVYEADSFIPDLIAMVLNEQRRDNPVADYNAIQRLQQRGATEREISECTGMPIGRIRRRMKLSTLHTELFEGLGHGKLSVTVAESVAGLPAARQESLLRRLREKGKLTMPDVREARTARKAEAVGALTLDGMGALLDPVSTPASLADIVAALSSTTLQRLRDELPGEGRFDAARQMIARELASVWRDPLTTASFTHASELVQTR